MALLENPGNWHQPCILMAVNSCIMKKVLFFSGFIALSACEFYYYDPYANPVSQLEGRYSVNDYSETYNSYISYSIWIVTSNLSAGEVQIDNFYGANIRVIATVSGNKITLFRQTVNGYTVEGSGTVYGNEITFIYSVRDNRGNSRTDFCEATAWRN